MNKQDAALTIVGAILDDMLGRRGFRQNWDDIDAQTRDEIVEGWRALVLNAMLAHETNETEKLRGYFDDPEDRLDREAAAEQIDEPALHKWLSGEGRRCLSVRAQGPDFEVQAVADGPPPAANAENARWMAGHVSPGLPAAIRHAQHQLEANLIMARRGRVP